MPVRVKPKLYVPDSVNYASPFADMFDVVADATNRYSVAQMKDCDFLMLTGGADIHPSYYGQDFSKQCPGYSDLQRDGKEWELIQEAILTDIPIIGICRGAQWLAIAAGGSLIQHVDNHEGGSHIITLDEPFEGRWAVNMSTDHHQMCNLSGIDHYLYAWTSRLSTIYAGEKNKELYPKGLTKEPEVFYIPKIRGFGVQGHPEYMSKFCEGNRYIRSLLSEIFNV